MSTNHDIACMIPDLLRVTDLQGSQSLAQEKLLGFVIAILPKCDLIAARGLRDRHGTALLMAIRRMSDTKLVAMSKSWNPHRPEPAKNASPEQLVNELTKLLRSEIQPAVKPARTAQTSTRATSARRRSALAAVDPS